MLSSSSLVTAGVLLLALVTVESGGWMLTRLARGKIPANELQTAFFRAGHAHAGVLLVLSLAILGMVDQASLDGFWRQVAGTGVPIAAILMPAGFFLSVLGREPQRPNRLIWLLWAGAVCLAAGLITAGTGLIAAA